MELRSIASCRQAEGVDGRGAGGDQLVVGGASSTVGRRRRWIAGSYLVADEHLPATLCAQAASMGTQTFEGLGGREGRRKQGSP